MRDVAWDPGWSGTVEVDGHRPVAVAVTHHGLVQQIVVPAGDDLVTFSYLPPHMLVAAVLSIGGVGVLLVLGGAMVFRRRASDSLAPADTE